MVIQRRYSAFPLGSRSRWVSDLKSVGLVNAIEVGGPPIPVMAVLVIGVRFAGVQRFSGELTAGTCAPSN